MNPNLFEDYAKKIPLKRVGQPKDIANAAFFLASEDSSYITVTDILVDGGYTQKNSKWLTLFTCYLIFAPLIKALNPGSISSDREILPPLQNFAPLLQSSSSSQIP